MENLGSGELEMLAWIIGIIALLFILIGTIRSAKPDNHYEQLRKYNYIKKRYLCGEINKHEFDELKRNLI